MSVIFLNGSGRLICDGVDAGQIEFSIAEPADGPDTTRRGKLWGNKQAVAVAMDAHHLLSLDVEDTDRQGGISFSVL